MKLTFWLKSLFLHSSQHNRRSRRQRTTLQRDLQRHVNQPLPAWVEILETRVLLAATFGDQNVISTAADGAASVYATDVDGDMDVLSASYNDDKIAWYENDVSQNFTPHIISTAADGAESVFAADGDGDMDVLSASYNDNTIAWYENLNEGGVTPALSIDDVSLAEGDSGETDFTFTISIDVASASDVNVDFATADDSAGAPDDYTAISGTATIAAGSTSATVTVKVQGDTTEEADETFFVNLSNPVNATIADNQGLGTIIDDDTVVNRQIVTLTPASQTATLGNSFTFDVIYTTDPLNETLPGLGLRLHFDSTQVQFDGLSNVLQTSLFLSPSVSADTDDFDSDPATDMLVSVAWADIGGNWPGVGNLPVTLYTANFTALGVGTATMNFSDTDTAGGYILDATSAEVTIITTNLDVDANGEATALTDGVLIVRYLFGATGTQLTDGVLGSGATRTDSAEIIAFLEPGLTTMLDVDANGEAGALTDGLLIVRYLFGVTGTQLTDSLLGTGATRTDPVEIIAFLDGFLPAAASTSIVVSTQDVLIANYDDTAVSVGIPGNVETGPNFAQGTFNDVSTTNVVTTTSDVVLPTTVSAPLLYPTLNEEESDDETLTEDAPVIVPEEQAELDTLFGDLDGSLLDELLAV
jgi:hypothetical protein